MCGLDCSIDLVLPEAFILSLHFFSLLNYNLVLSLHLFITLSPWVFFLPRDLFLSSTIPPFPLPFFYELSHLLLHSCISLFQTACIWLSPSSNMQYILKELRSHVFNLKAPKSSVSGTATVFLSFFPSSAQ